MRVQASGLRTEQPVVRIDGYLVRSEGLAPTAVRAALGVWEPVTTLTGCRVVAPQTDGAGAARLLLLDAGLIHLWDAVGETRVAPRWMPMGQSPLDGVFYAYEAPTRRDAVRSGEPVELHAEGGPDLAPFSVQGQWPSLAAWVSVDSEWVGDRALVERPAQPTVRIAYQGEPKTTWVQVAREGFLDARHIECHFPDTTAVTFDIAALVDALGPADAWEFTVRSVARVPMQTDPALAGVLQVEILDRVVVEQIDDL